MTGRPAIQRRPLRAALAAVLAALAILAIIWGGGIRNEQSEKRPAPNLSFKRGDGKATSLAELRGKAILLNVWATWCLSCRTEMPSLDRLQAKLGSPVFEVIALSVDRAGEGVVTPFFAETGIKHLAMYLNPEGDAVRAFKITGLPTTVLIGSDGTERRRWIGPKEWDAPDVFAEVSGLISASPKPGARGAPP